MTLGDVFDNGTPDDAGDDVACTVTTPAGTDVLDVPAGTASGDNVTPGTAAATYHCSFDEAHPPSYSGTNTVTMHWGESSSSSYQQAVSFAQDEKVDWTVDVLDDKTDPENFGKIGSATWNAAGTPTAITYAVTKRGVAGRCTDYTNTAYVDVTGTESALLGSFTLDVPWRPTAQAGVEVCAEAPLKVSKSVDAGYDRTYLWGLTKQVDKTKVDVTADGTATFEYTVTAVPDGYRDSGHRLSGEVTIENPNEYKDVTVHVTDAVDLDPAQVCRFPDGQDLVVEAGTSRTVGYDCLVSGVTESDYSAGDDTTTVTWQRGQDTGTVTETSPVTFVEKSSIDKSVTVVDDKTDPSTPSEPLGTATWDLPATQTFTYPLEKAGVAGECRDYTNTATIDLAGGRKSANSTVTVCGEPVPPVEPEAPQVRGTAVATYDRQYFWKVEKDVDRTEAEIVDGQSARFTYTVKAVPDRTEDSDRVLAGDITVENPNPDGPVRVTLEDFYDNGTPDDEADDARCTVTYPSGSGLDVPAATGSGDRITPGTATARYSCRFDEQHPPAYSGTNWVTMHWGDGSSTSVRQSVTFTQLGATDKTVAVVDDKTDPSAAPVTLGTATWDKPETHTFTYSLTKSGVVGERTDYTNTATIELEGEDASDSETVTVAVEDELDITKTVDASFGRSYHWLIDKTVDKTRVELTGDKDAVFHYTVKATPDGSSESGYTMGGTITVTNPNTYDGGAITATVTDVPNVGGGAACVVAGGQSVRLAPKETRTLAYSCSFTGQPSHSGSNLATVSWLGPDQKGRSTSTGPVPVRFSSGGEANSSVTVTDSMTTPSVLGTAIWNSSGEPTEFTYSLTHKGKESSCVDYTNTATISQTGQSDSETVTVCHQGALVVTNTAEASYDRAYRWDITKVADRTRIDTRAGGAGTVGYTVGVTPTGYADSGWEMAGTVTVSNPNAHKDVTVRLTEVPDLGEDATCVFDETEDFLVEAGETRAFTYTCEFEKQPSYDGSSTVLVDWGAGKVEATAEVVFEVDEETDKTVDVTDDMLEPGDLGQVTWDASGRTVEFEYAIDLEGQVGECQTVTNTAAIVETGQEARADVEVCGPEIEDEEEQPPVKPKPPVKPHHPVQPGLPIKPELPVKARPPADLPDTGAPSGAGAMTMLGGLMVALGAALLVRRRRGGVM